MNPTRVVFASESLESAFNSLSEEDQIKKAIRKAVQSIKEDPFAGRNVKKKIIPKEIIQKYNINNLWIYNLPSAWRLIYSLTSGEVEIIAVVLDWMNHKEYERLFKF